MWHVKGCMCVQIGPYVSYGLNNCSGWHRQKKISITALICSSVSCGWCSYLKRH